MFDGSNEMKRSLSALFGSTLLLLFFLLSAFGVYKNGAILSQETIRSTSHIIPENEAGIIHVDVGQGDSAIVVSKERKTMVIDTGDNAVSYAYPNIKRILDDNNLKELEYVVLTHPHQDHIGNTLSLLSDYDIGSVVLNGAVSTNETYQNILSFIDSKNISTSFVQKGDSLSLGSMKVDILASTPEEAESNENNASIVLLLTDGNFTEIFTGDAEEKTEQKIVSSFDSLPVDVLKVSHHGSHDSTSEGFLQLITPSLAIISVSKNNEYGHPHPETINRLQKRNIQVFDTKTFGTVTILLQGENYEVYTDRDSN